MGDQIEIIDVEQNNENDIIEEENCSSEEDS